jgi:hypothetical protein
MAPCTSIRVEANSEFADLSIRRLLERYSGGAFCLKTTLDGLKHTPAAVEPGIGGRRLGQDELQAGDIVLATALMPGPHGIPSQRPTSRALICQDSQHIIDTKYQTFVVTTVADVLAISQTATVFRIQVGGETDAGQREIGTMLGNEASRKVGTPMFVEDEKLGRPAWVQVARPYFAFDRYVFKESKNRWLGPVHLGASRTPNGYFAFYCSWLFLDTLSAAGRASDKESLRFWFTVDEYWKTVRSQDPVDGEAIEEVTASLDAIRVFQPLGYVGHLKGPN